MATTVKITSHTALPPCSRIWLMFFVVSIMFVGLFLMFGICVPLFLLGRLFPTLESRADWLMCWVVRLVLHMQPWLLGEIDLDLQLTPGRSYLFVSNHRSHLDAFILLANICGVRILAKKSLFYVPFLGIMMSLSRQIPVARGQAKAYLQALQTIRDQLRKGGRVHIFPEMSRCSPEFEGTQKFSLAPFLIAKQENISIIPIVFSGTDLVWPKGTLGLRFRQPFGARVLAMVDPSLYASAELLMNDIQKRINGALK